MTHIVIPAHNTHETLPRVLSEIPEGLLEGVIVVDDGSEPALHCGNIRVIRHPHCKGYGATQKTGFGAAIADGAKTVLLLHGDGQYATDEVLSLGPALAHADAVLGSRFLVNNGLGIPTWRRWGNRVLTTLANQRFGCSLTDMHSGARAYNTRALSNLPLDQLSDDYAFDHEILSLLLLQGCQVAERPVTPRYDETVQSIALWPATRYATACLGHLARPPRPRP